VPYFTRHASSFLNLLNSDTDHSGLHKVRYEVLLTLVQTVDHQTVSTPCSAYVTFIIYANPLQKHLVPFTSVIRYCTMCLVSANCPMHVLYQNSNLLNRFEALIISEHWMSLSNTYLTCVSEFIDTHTSRTCLLPLSCPNSLHHNQHKVCTLFCCEGWNITRLLTESLWMSDTYTWCFGRQQYACTYTIKHV